ncbi:MAG: hypothetical protein V1903_04830 [Bacteroidota bacterium]
MNSRKTGISIILLTVSIIIQGQSGTENSDPGTSGLIYGFIRGGFYGGTDENDKIHIPSSFADLSLKADKNGSTFRAYADLRFRYGTEFLSPVTRLDIREAFVSVHGKKWDISAGEKIIKWGRADFTNPTSKISSQNLLSRSPDREDMDQGNILLSARWAPLPFLSLEAVGMPYYRPSELMVELMPVPSYAVINPIGSLVTGRDKYGYGIRAGMHLQGADMSISWFDGYEPMPGIELTRFDLDLSGPMPAISAELSLMPYRIRNIGYDFETTIGSFGIRGEAAWSLPYESYKTYEYVACEEIEWAAGIDWMPGNWRITAEYSGKFITDFEEAAVDPIIGTEPDLAQLALLMATPGFDLTEYVRQQVGAFNRLYNYQLEKIYHSAGVRVETDLFYGKLTPSLTSLYNVTSGDFLFMPEVIYKPADGLTINLGGEFYSGKDGSIYDLIDEFMNCIRISLRVDF